MTIMFVCLYTPLVEAVQVTSKPIVVIDEEISVTNYNESVKTAKEAMDAYRNSVIDNDVDSTVKEKDKKIIVDLPYYNQTDNRWGSNKYGNTTIKVAGCGPTALSMVVSGLTYNEITPDEIANWSNRNGYVTEGGASYWTMMIDGATKYGLNVESVSRENPERIKEALSEEKLIIVSMGPGNFTETGHFIVLRGMTSEGKVLVNDPVSVERSNQEWNLDTIMKESSKNDGENGSPFWIYN